jgi:trk system potassium uptake protein TrkA
VVEEATGATDTVALLRLSGAGVNVIETTISASSRSAGHPLGEIGLPDATIVAAVIRDGRPIAPDATFVVRPGDELLIVSERASGPDIHAAFQ